MTKIFSPLLLNLALFFMMLFSSTAHAQEGFICGTDEARKQLIERHPEVLQQEEQLELFTKNFVANYQKTNSASRSFVGPVIIPVVFHIVHQGGLENISDAQVLDQVRILNRDYNAQNDDTSLVTDPALKNVIANMGIEFRLANIDPQGNCTNGIDRVYSVQTNVGNDYSKLNNWPRDNYLNVWVVNRMRGGAAGYAYYPGSVQAIYNAPAMDGVILLHDYIGSIGTSSPFKARALTHELGHCLNLKHTWGDTNQPGIACGDDGVDDTPLSMGWTFCPTNSKKDICKTGIIENYQNYMDYSFCSVMFTEGQRLRAIAAMDTMIAGRHNLYSPQNLAATGVLNNTPTPCAPKADFFADKRYVCLNGFVTFKDNSLNGKPTAYSWEFINGAPSESDQANPKVQFLVPGWQPVKLTVTNDYGSSSKTDSFLVYVGYDNTLTSAPYYEGFDDADVFTETSRWTSVNVDQNNTFFKQINVGHNGKGSAVLNNYFARGDRDVDEIISPPMDLSGLDKNDMNLSFYYSWASNNANFTSQSDSIAVLATNDCGATWIPLLRKDGSAILGFWEGYWTPSRESGVWRKEEVSMAGGSLYDKLHRSNIRFKIQIFSSVGGNNFYIDDFNVGFAEPALSIQEESYFKNVTLFPNPTNGTTSLAIDAAQASGLSVKVYDISGRLVSSVYDGKIGVNQSMRLQLNANKDMASGVYIVNIVAGQSVVQRKLIIQ